MKMKTIMIDIIITIGLTMIAIIAVLRIALLIVDNGFSREHRHTQSIHYDYVVHQQPWVVLGLRTDRSQQVEVYSIRNKGKIMSGIG